MEKFKSEHKIIYCLFIFPMILLAKGLLLFWKICVILLMIPVMLILWSLGDILVNSISGNEGKSRRRTRHY